MDKNLIVDFFGELKYPARPTPPLLFEDSMTNSAPVGKKHRKTIKLPYPSCPIGNKPA